MATLQELKNELKKLNAEYAKIKDLPADQRADFGKELNIKKQQLNAEIAAAEAAAEQEDVAPLDISAPCDINGQVPEFLTADFGSKHPLMTELDRVIAIYQSMGFDIAESVQLDDEFLSVVGNHEIHAAVVARLRLDIVEARAVDDGLQKRQEQQSPLFLHKRLRAVAVLFTQQIPKTSNHMLHVQPAIHHVIGHKR